MDRFAQLIVAAARQAEQDSGLDVAPEADRIGAAIATGIGGLTSFQDCHDVAARPRPRPRQPVCDPGRSSRTWARAGSRWSSARKGPLASECTACAASNMAIGDGTDAIRLGRADVMFCGGTEAAINKVGIAGFGAMRALSRRNDDPKRASRPFDAGRDGFVMGEVGAVLVLEELEHAKARGAKIYAEIAGYGVSADASHITEPDPTGQNPARARDHGDGRRRRDARPDRLRQRARDLDADRRRERDARDQARDGRGAGVPDPGLRHEGRDRPLPRRAGAVEAMFTTLAVHEGMLPPTINYEVEDPECDLDYVPNESRARPTSASRSTTRSASAGTTPAS